MLGLFGVGVFSDSEEVIPCNDAEVCGGFGAWVEVKFGLVVDVVNDRVWKSNF